MALACRSPSAVKGRSVYDVCRCALLHSVSPWRTRTTSPIRPSCAAGFTATAYGCPMGSPIFELCDDHVTRTAALDPVLATYLGIPGQDGQGTDYGPDGVAARAELSRDTL